MTSPLESCGKPLFFRVADPAGLGLVPPSNRKGEAVRTFARSLSVMQKEALLVSSRGGPAWRLSSDEGPYLMGDDVAPCPLSFLTTGMAASYMNEILSLARQRGADIRDIRLVLDNHYTMNGSLLAGTMTGGALPVDLGVEIDSDDNRDALLRLVHDAVALSPLNGLLRGELQSQFTLTHNGRSIDTGRVRNLRRTAEPDPGDRFDPSRPDGGDWSTLILRGGPTPRNEEATSSRGSSLAEKQHRRLHLRGICTLGPDGMKRVEQHLYNPLGSIFHFLSEEAEAAGGKGRAPDAATYISAGIAFCFMTQFGRYAKVVKKDLREYRITQDTHFSLGGSAGSTGKAGEAEPVETHVHLVTDEDDIFAQTALDMAEQTCFLHALCRTEVETNVRIGQSSLE